MENEGVAAQLQYTPLNQCNSIVRLEWSHAWIHNLQHNQIARIR